MKNISVPNVLEVLNLSLQAGFIGDNPEEIEAVASIVSRLTRRFLEDCQETNNLPTDEMRETIEIAEEFLNIVINNHNIDFVDEVESHGVCLCIIDTIRSLGRLKALVKSKW